jgi:hypothetical protein
MSVTHGTVHTGDITLHTNIVHISESFDQKDKGHIIRIRGGERGDQDRNS